MEITGKLLQPVVFNAITIVAMLYALSQMVIEAPRLLSSSTAIMIEIEKLAQVSDTADESLVSTFAADQSQRRNLFNEIIVVMVVAIVANFIANYLGRGRHHTNTSRIRELEAELRALRED
ncbi:MAG: hypothetical protein OXI52_13180 [Caldilineaceae bacterium]|nr:hypothetical protein [Caldilineaceae bacterium]